VAEKEVTLIKDSELKDGEMKTFEVEGGQVLLVNSRGNFYAIGAKCTHYGAPLEQGALSEDRIVCPWHHAAFDFKTGLMKEPPALDHLATFKVKIENGKVIVVIPEKMESSRECCFNTKREMAIDSRCFAIVGAGSAATAAALTLRENGFQGRVLMLTHEDKLPYDRPELSKGYLEGESKEEWLPLRSKEFFNKHDIEVLRNEKVIGLNSENKIISLSSNEVINFDSLLLAPGSIPNRLDIPGADLDNIFTLRSRDDVEAIIKAAGKASRAVIIGASFIGLETAASLKKRGLEITIVAPEKVPFEKTLGNEVGNLFKELHEKNGVEFKLGNEAKAFEGKGKVQGVVLKSGEKIPADFVLLGVGAKPATGFRNDLKLDSDGGIEVDEYFKVEENIFAAGDIARFPYWFTGEKVRIEHWRTAQQQGRTAALNMLGIRTPYKGVPYFWTKQYELNLRYVGFAASWDDIVIDGDIPSQDFIVFYVKDGKVLAAAGVNRDHDMAVIEELIRKNKMPPANKLSGQTERLAGLLR
jgi:NADPH-dependent 2,4-dienoyl-CoA reductase/sulfur reductase-like enzyme/nitrite reductase/ring-hydroxylating ferredoxin subunit